MLLRGLDGGAGTASALEEIRRGLRQAVRRGVFLVHGSNPEEAVFVLNNDAGRRALSQLKASGGAPASGLGPDEAPARARERLNIFALYEDTIGLLSPMIAERLKEAEQRYPARLDPGGFRDSGAGKQAKLAVCRRHPGPLGLGGQGQLVRREQG